MSEPIAVELMAPEHVPIGFLDSVLRGPPGAAGADFQPDATGLLADRGDFDAEAPPFAFLATDTSDLYFRQGDTPGVWSDPVPFGGTSTPGAGDGDVVGPSSSTNGHAAVFDGTTGKRLRQAGGPPMLAGDAVAIDQVTGLEGALSDKANTADLGTAAGQDVEAFATAAQGALADSAIQPGNPALSDAREWTAAEVSEAEAAAGTGTTARKWPALRVRQAIVGWWTALLEAGKIPAIYLPSYVDDVIEADDFTSLPPTGETGKIYVTRDLGHQYRWSGLAYVQLVASPGSTDAVPEGAANLYFTAARAIAAVTWGTLTGIPAWITGATAYGQGFAGLADAAAGRAKLDLGTAATAASTDFATAAQGALADTAVQPADLGTAAAEDVGAFATAAQGALADTSIQPSDARLTDAREWTATEVSQPEAEGGTATTPRKWTALRVRQAAAAWWASILDGAGKIPASLLPSYVDDVIEVANFAALPVTGEAGKIYVTVDDNAQHRWSGSAYVTLTASPGSTDAVPEGSLNLYFTAARALAAVTWGTLSGIPAWITGAGTMASQRILARNTAGSGVPEEVSLSQLLDWASNTPGSILFRGASGWQGLAPTTAGFLLQTGGVGADPSWRDDSDFVVGTGDLTQFAAVTPVADFRDLINGTTGTGPLVFSEGPQITFGHDTIAYAATVNLDMAALSGRFRTISLTGNLELTSSNRAVGRTVTLRLIADASTRTLTFPAGWVFIGAKPADIAANKTGVLSLSFFGTADSDCVAAWSVQA